MSVLFTSRCSFSFSFVVATTVLALMTGCVTQGRYDEIVKQRDQLREQTDSLELDTGILNAELMLRDLDVAQLEREQKELADEVARWAVRGAIEMQMLADGLHLVLPHDVLFASGTTQLSEEGHELIVELVQEIGEQPYQIAVLGFTDNVSVGPKLAKVYPSNWDLAGARASSVVRVMEEEGIPADQLIAVSRGETGPIASNESEEGRARNRRIDVHIRPIIKKE